MLWQCKSLQFAFHNDTYGGRQGKHDDLVLVGVLALWQAERSYCAQVYCF